MQMNKNQASQLEKKNHSMKQKESQKFLLSLCKISRFNLNNHGKEKVKKTIVVTRQYARSPHTRRRYVRE